MTPDGDSKLLHEAMQQVCDRQADRPVIVPAWLATEVMQAIGFPRDLHPLGYHGCHLQLRQLARSFCRRNFEPDEQTDDDLFPETLQRRYPREPTGDEPEYVLREHMTRADYRYNVARLRKEGAAKLKHADALEDAEREKFSDDVEAVA